MRLNGAPYDNAELKRVSGYVMQDDLLSAFLTVEETLRFTAELRLPRTFTHAERKQRVDEVLKDLGLEHARHDVIGIQSKRGISGSERKRLCVCMQLLNRPQLLFLDEPTTGLDSVTALDLLYTLHALAHGKSQDKAVTIVCSIHQPQAKIFNLFDSIVLLKAGHNIYQGSRKQAPVKNKNKNKNKFNFINHIYCFRKLFVLLVFLVHCIRIQLIIYWMLSLHRRVAHQKMANHH